MRMRAKSVVTHAQSVICKSIFIAIATIFSSKALKELLHPIHRAKDLRMRNKNAGKMRMREYTHSRAFAC